MAPQHIMVSDSAARFASAQRSAENLDLLTTENNRKLEQAAQELIDTLRANAGKAIATADQVYYLDDRGIFRHSPLIFAYQTPLAHPEPIPPPRVELDVNDLADTMMSADWTPSIDAVVEDEDEETYVFNGATLDGTGEVAR